MAKSNIVTVYSGSAAGGMASTNISPVAVTPSSVELYNKIIELENRLNELNKIVTNHQAILNENKVIKNSYIDTVMSKIDILKNMIKKNMNNEDFFSHDLTVVETIESQIKATGKISPKQFDELNKIYINQKDMNF